MRSRSLLVTALVAASVAACGSEPRDQEDVTVPGEGPTYAGDSAAPAAPPMATTPGGTPGIVADTVPRRDSVLPPP